MSIIDFDRLLEICELVIIIELDFRWFEASLAFFNKFLASTSALFAFSSILEIFLYSILYSSSEIMNFLAGCLCTIIVLHKSSKNCFSCPIFSQFSQFFELFLISLFFGEFFKKSSLLQLSIKESSHSGDSILILSLAKTFLLILLIKDCCLFNTFKCPPNSFIISNNSFDFFFTQTSLKLRKLSILSFCRIWHKRTLPNHNFWLLSFKSSNWSFIFGPWKFFSFKEIITFEISLAWSSIRTEEFVGIILDL